MTASSGLDPETITTAEAEAERRYPALRPDAEELTYPRSALRDFTRGAFVEGAKWEAGRDAQVAEKAWDEAVAMCCQMLGARNVNWPNPYRRTDA